MGDSGFDSPGFWTNRSVLTFAAGDDPMVAVVRRAREIVFDAVNDGWTGPPFEPLGIARRLGIVAIPRDDLRDARVVAADNCLRIEYNPDRPRGRLRFSIAHEIAHTFFPDVAELPRHRTPIGAVPHSGDDWQVELLCNIAAGELLMPGAAFPDAELDAASRDIDRLMVLRAKFDVSTEALLRRVVQATDAPSAMFAAASTGTANRFRIDYTAPSRTWSPAVGRGQIVSSGSLAECTAVGYTSRARELWGSLALVVQAVGIPPYPGEALPRVAGLISPVVEAPSMDSRRLQFVTGDAARPRGVGPWLIVHVVNNRAKSWGGQGFARQLGRVYPQAAQAYRAWTIAATDNLRLGNTHFVAVNGGETTIASLVAQEGFGRSRSTRLRYEALSRCLRTVADRANATHSSIHMPRIGIGQAGGLWNLVEDEIDRTIVSTGADVTVYTRPGEHGDLVLSQRA